MTHIEIEHEPMGLIIRADGIVGPDGCDDAGCYDIGTYVPDRSKPRQAVFQGSSLKMYPKKWVSLMDGLDDTAKAMLKLNINEMFYEELKTDIEWKEEQGRE